MNEHIHFDLDKFKRMIQYVLGKWDYNGNACKNMLFGALYFADFDYYELNEVPIAGEKYVKNAEGIFPAHFAEVMREIKGECKRGISDLNLSSLTCDELEMIDEVMARLSSMSFDEVAKHCRGDFPWRLSQLNGELNYEAVFYREPEYSLRSY